MIGTPGRTESAGNDITLPLNSYNDAFRAVSPLSELGCTSVRDSPKRFTFGD